MSLGPGAYSGHFVGGVLVFMRDAEEEESLRDARCEDDEGGGQLGCEYECTMVAQTGGTAGDEDSRSVW